MSLAATLAVVVGLVAAAGGKPEGVSGIKDASLEVTHWAKPPALVVRATGEVKSAGYTQPALTRVKYVMPPADGVQEYSLTAVPPAGLAAQVIAEVSAEDTWVGYEAEAPWFKGVRIKGSGNEARELWVKGDVVVDTTAAGGRAKVGQVVEAQTTYGVFPPFPSDFAVTVNGKPVAFNGFAGSVRQGGQVVVGASLYSYLFKVTEPGKQSVVVSYKRGDQKTEKVVELVVK